MMKTTSGEHGRRHNHRNHQARKEFTIPDTQKEIDKLSHNFSRPLYISKMKKLNPTQGRVQRAQFFKCSNEIVA